MLPYNPVKIGVLARGQDGDKSDIDILYRFKDPISLSQIF